jgi:UDP-N-acetylmuramoyl-L-alanyl-D-glutamate--2,6-diaminopimelate ligase
MLAELVRSFGGNCELGDREGPPVRGIQLDSRRVQPGEIYAALEGSRADGARFVPDALARGACAVLSTRPLPCEVPLWVHPEARGLVGRVAARLSGDPARGMAVVAITGTNGKTTTAWVTASLLAAAGRRPGLLGTIQSRLADGSVEASTHTTPDAPELWSWISRQREAGGDSIVLEASSHALEQERLSGLVPDVAIFTNLTRDHLDYHGSMERYAEAKARLFDALAPGGAAVVPADDPASEQMAARALARGARVLRYGIRPGVEDARPSGLDRVGSRVDLGATLHAADLQGCFLTLSGMGFHGVGVRLPLIGRHNVENALAALAAARLTGASPSALAEGLATVASPPGRLERVPAPGRGFAVFVDYAHTEDSLRRVLGVLRSAAREEARPAGRAPGRLLCVFGCGGERDRGKREPMGRAGGGLADLAGAARTRSTSCATSRAAWRERGRSAGSSPIAAPRSARRSSARARATWS